MQTIFNASSQPLNIKSGSIPDVSGALKDYFQIMTFTKIVKSIIGFENFETPTPINFQGVLYPMTGRRLELKPEGQRAWTWLILYADPVITLEVDEVVVYNNKQTRVMSQKDFGLYGYVEYELVQDFTGSGP